MEDKIFKKFKILILVIILSIISFIFIRNILKSNKSGNYKIDFNPILSSNYKIEEFKSEFSMNSPNSFQYYNDYIYITDTNNNRIIKVNLDGKIVKEIGKSGNGDLEFLKPSCITVINDLIYIFDKDNVKIKIYDLDFSFIKFIDLSSIYIRLFAILSG